MAYYTDKARNALMCQLRAEGMTYKAIGVRFHVTKQRVEQVVKGRRFPSGSSRTVEERVRLWRMRGRTIGWLAAKFDLDPFEVMKVLKEA